jgi:hypothetical protein
MAIGTGMQGSGNTTCSNCGTVNEPGSSFCKNCGNRMEERARYCQSCGKQLPGTSVALCPACGAVVGQPGPGTPAGVGAETAGATAQTAQGYGAYYANPPPGSRFAAVPPSEADFAALSKMKLFGLIGIIEFVIPILLLSAGELSFAFLPRRAGAPIIGGLTVLAGAVLLLGLVLDIYSIFLARSAFSMLSRTDSRFSTPAKLVTLMIVGLLIAAGLVLLIVVPGFLFSTGTLVLLVVLLIVLVIFLLLGLIGLLLGIWRMGTRYQDDGFKVAAVLFLIPFLSVVGAILVYASSHSLIRRFQSR